MQGKILDFKRALLFSKGIDPNPSNVSKISEETATHSAFSDAFLLGLEHKNYWVFEGDSVLNLVTDIILSKPWALDSKYLALFISGAFHPDFDFDNIIRVAEGLKSNLTAETRYTLFKMIEMDDFMQDHIREFFDFEFGGFHEGLRKTLEYAGFDEVSETDFRGRIYFIAGYRPDTILDIQCNEDF